MTVILRSNNKDVLSILEKDSLQHLFIPGEFLLCTSASYNYDEVIIEVLVTLRAIKNILDFKSINAKKLSEINIFPVVKKHNANFWKLTSILQIKRLGFKELKTIHQVLRS